MCPQAKKKKDVKRADFPSKFKQDILGILLIALAIFIFMANLSSATGFVGLFVVKQALRSILGVGIYLLPLFVALYGFILLIRHEVKELTTRLLGLLLMFLVFITAAQFTFPNYFVSLTKYPLVQGAGGAVGFALKFIMEKAIGKVGSYLFLSALGLIGFLLFFNVTFQSLVLFFLGLFKRSASEKKQGALEKKEVKSTAIATQMPLLKEIPPVEKEVVPAPPPPPKLPVEFPFPKFEPEEKEEEKKLGKISSKKEYAKYKLPPLDLLEDPSPQEKQKVESLRKTTELRKRLLEEALTNFGVGARVVAIYQGPAVTRYELQPDPGVKVSKIASLADDIALNLASQGVRIEAPVPGKSVVGIEVPNATVIPVRLKEIVRTAEFQNNASKLYLGIGKDLSGNPVFGDLTRMPHLLIAGTTGSGKSVCINSLITSILLRARPDEVKFMMIDPKMVELSVYEGIAHLVAPVVTDPRKASRMLKDGVIKEMERRYRLFHDAGVRNIQAYNHKVKEEALPYMVVIVDELADLMMVAATEVETTICRIAQMARATGIHLVIATQRPSVDIITGLIKANIPSRIAFAVATQVDSRVILDMAGAEKLLGRGDMLYNPIGAMKPIRVQGSFVTDRETERIIKFIKDQAEPEYLEDIASIKVEEVGVGEGEEQAGRDSLFGEVAKLIIESGQASTSYIQRKFRIGYNRAARLMDEMEAAGIVSPPEGELKTRRVTATREILKTLGVE